MLVLGVALAASASGSLDPPPAAAVCQPASASTGSAEPSASATRPDGLTDAQLGNARTIYTTSVQLGLPARAANIAIATALQESNLTNHGHLGAANDHDSLGLFQQRPSQGWGTPAEIMNPAVAARKFYTKLLGVTDWETLPLTVAAQRVQKSAYPDAYTKHEPLATAIVNHLSGGGVECATPGAISPAG
jgi:hypothetical protein